MALLAQASLIWISTLFVYSGSLKLVRYKNLARAASGYRLIPRFAVTPIGYALPVAELVIVLGLFVRAAEKPAAIAAACVGASFGVMGADVLRRGLNVSCGCTGSPEDTVGWDTVARAVLIASAGSVIYIEAPRLPTAAAAIAVVVALAPTVAFTFRQLQTWVRLRQQREAVAAEVAYMSSLIGDSR